MPRPRDVVITAVLVSLAATPAASGDRKANGNERRGVQRAVLKSCRKADQGCRRAPVRVSTVDRRYAFGGAFGMNYYGGALVKRSGGRWKVLKIAGGGIDYCSSWFAVAPDAVIRDLDLKGLRYQGDSGGGPC